MNGVNCHRKWPITGSARNASDFTTSNSRSCNGLCRGKYQAGAATLCPTPVKAKAEVTVALGEARDVRQVDLAETDHALKLRELIVVVQRAVRSTR